ncbi:hypothetical protein WDU94_011006 [Cyamophila willieti]
MTLAWSRYSSASMVNMLINGLLLNVKSDREDVYSAAISAGTGADDEYIVVAVNPAGGGRGEREDCRRDGQTSNNKGDGRPVIRSSNPGGGINLSLWFGCSGPTHPREGNE